MFSIRLACVGRALLAFISGLLLSTLISGKSQGQPAQDAAAKVPVKRVVLFSSGVGYFQHQGQVTGNAAVDLKFQVDDVNDLLKSMVLEDLGGGQISTVTYGSRDPITKTLKTFAIDLTTNPTLGQLLSQVRGEKVEINAPTAITGTIVGVETQKQSKPVPGGQQVVDVELLNLLTDDGLRRIPLDSIGRIKLASAELDAEFRQALTVLATAHATDKKTVTLNFLGQGDRQVRVGYIQESPVWKTSYRLVLDDKEKPFLQGWAIVENTSDEDWKDVNLSLVSGRPISFVMDLYSPLYAQRPLERMEMYASLRPQVYGQDLEEKAKQFQAAAQGVAGATPANQPLAGGFAGGGRGGRGGGQSARAADRFARGEGNSDDAAQDFLQLQQTFDIKAAVQGGDVGELFKYDIKNPVTLARQRSAMLPIINEPVDGEKLSIYNPNVQAKHPLNGVRLKNSSKLHLMQGPMTVFDGGVYAGDSKIPDLPPDSERLLSYALDLDVEVAPTSDQRPQRILSAKIVKGVMETAYKTSRQQKYVVKNSGRQAKTVLIEHQIDTSWTLLAPKEPTEKTRDLYRFAVKAEPGKPADLAIDEERTDRQSVAINNLNDDAIRIYLSERVISDSVKEALKEVVRRKAELAALNQRRQQITQEIAAIDQEQNRIRQNMQSIDRNTDLYNRYVKKFTDQEDQVERFRGEARELDQQIVRAQRALDDYLTNMELS
ncbi:MAG: hypothetical protein WD669_05300 [Pirellulales bacterium]